MLFYLWGNEYNKELKIGESIRDFLLVFLVL
jgi:hypothetical protein